MISLPAAITIGLLCTLIGAAAGAFWGSRFSSTPQKTKDLEKHLHEKQNEIKTYQREVTDHFTETSLLLKQLAESYKDIHNHLATGADKLSDQGYGNTAPIIEKLVSINNEAQATPDSVTAPLDYAPKSSPYDKGTLNEDFNLEKVELNEKLIQAEAIAEAIAENAQKS